MARGVRSIVQRLVPNQLLLLSAPHLNFASTKNTKIAQIFVRKIGESNISCAAFLWLNYFVLQNQIISYNIVCVNQKMSFQDNFYLRTSVIIVGDGV